MNASFFEFILLDMAIRSLQQDYTSLETLKMSKVYIHIANMLLKKLRNDSHNKKSVLAKKNIKIVNWERVSEYFSDVTVKSSGNDEVFHCAKQALKTQVEEIIMEHLKSHSLEK